MSNVSNFSFKNAFQEARACYNYQFSADKMLLTGMDFQRNEAGQMVVDLSDGEKMYAVARQLKGVNCFVKIWHVFRLFLAELHAPGVSSVARNVLCDEAIGAINHAAHEEKVLAIWEIGIENSGGKGEARFRYLFKERVVMLPKQNLPAELPDFRQIGLYYLLLAREPERQLVEV